MGCVAPPALRRVRLFARFPVWHPMERKMKLTQMIYSTVIAFEPKRHPCYALVALAMLLTALIALAYLGGTGVAGAIRKVW